MMDSGASSISVTVRVRPFTIREAAQLSKSEDGTVFLGDGSLAAAPTPKLQPRGIRSVIKVVDERCLIFDPPEDNPVQRFSRSVVPSTGKRVKDQTFGFDRVFDDTASQSDIYEHTTRTLLDSVLDGYNATVFAYGATGCGKTHTITGTPQQPGIIFLTMQELFEKISERSDEKHTEISLSYLEIYNETIRDLLVPGGSKQGLMLREDANQTVSVAGLSSHRPKDVSEVMDMIVKGNEYRTMSPTEANATSSRSHAVLQINVIQKDRNADVNEPHTMATLSIIDLAGSERASATKNRGERLIEGANINKSLLALGSCINALCDPRKRNHVPYRNSKLTRLLKFSLGGNCKTVMIVCVSPSSQHFDETQNTLRYANRAKNIQTKVTRNVFNVNRHVKDYLVKIDEQRALIEELRAQQRDNESQAFVKFKKQSEKREGIAREGIVKIRSAYDTSVSERQEKINDMKRLRQAERRIGVLSAWIAAFDNVVEMRRDSEMPESLAAMKKTAQGILFELEHSRQHFHQKLNKNNWERTLDSALHNSIRQLREQDAPADSSEAASVTREAEILKANASREALQELLEMEKTGDLPLMQVLLSAQLEIISSLSDILSMREEEAVQHAKVVLGKLLDTCSSAVSQAVKPDSSLTTHERFSPSKRGTPRKKSSSIGGIDSRPIPIMPAVAAFGIAPQVFASPMKSSPKRRKAAAAKKGVSFTPKKKAPAKRSVRWRDDTESGALADFEKTPQRIPTPKRIPTPQRIPIAVGSPQASPSASAIPLPKPSYLESERSNESSGSSPIPTAPQMSSDLRAKNSRFQAGFLTRKSSSPKLSPSRLRGSASDSDLSPLRNIDPSRASNRPSLLGNPISDSINTGSLSGSDGENVPLAGEDGIRIRKAMRRVSAAHSPIHSARSRRSPSPTSGMRAGSPPTENQLFTASQARRMVKSDKPVTFQNAVLSPRTAAVMKQGRRITLDGKHQIPTAGAQAMRIISNGSATLPRVRESTGVSAKAIWR